MNEKSSRSDPKAEQIKLVSEYLLFPRKSDDILSARADLTDGDPRRRAAAQALFMAFLRCKISFDAAFAKIFQKPPRLKLRSLLYAAAADAVSSEPSKIPQVVDSWVEFAKNIFSKGEAGFVNAVLRKFPGVFEQLKKSADSPAAAALAYGHPQWLAERWTKTFGFEKTLEILKLNEKPSEVFFRKSDFPQADAIFDGLKEFFEPSKFRGFFKLKSGKWREVSELLDSPYFYVQDPSTFSAPETAAPKAGESVLDLCAAPGGKSRTLADIMAADAIKNGTLENLKYSLIVSVDSGEERMKLLKQNLSKLDFLKTRLIECDLESENLSEKLAGLNLPEKFDLVFLDAPCSNTGVLRRRPDARLRLSESDIKKCSETQFKLLETAAKFVKEGGRLVYSTCSIDPEENEINVQKFASQNKEFKLLNGFTVFPSEENDGAGVFLLSKTF